MINNPSKKSARNLFTVLFILGLVACVIPVNLAAFAFSNTQSASIVIGQSGFTTSTGPNPPTVSSERFPRGAAFDSSGNLWITDAQNGRVLEYLKGSGFTSGQSASIIIGRSSFTDNSTAANPPTAASLRFPSGITFDSSGNLWVSDSANHRILEYLKGSGFTSGQSASIIIGKSSFTDNSIINPPNVASEHFVQGITFDSSGNLWIGDTGNNRVLEYLKGSGFTCGQSASLILGRSSFTDNSTAANPPTAASVNFPQGLTFDSSGNLWVGDSFNNRVLEYLKGSGFTSGQSASLVIGQSGFTTSTSATSQTGLTTLEPAFNGPTFDSSGNLWVTDEINNRVLEYLGTAVSVSVPEFPFGIPIVIASMSAFYFMMRRKFSLKI